MYSATFSDRFWRKVNIGAPDECWLWTAMTNGVAGYGQIRRGAATDGMVLAHRAAWELANNTTVPDGMYVLHSCDTRLCCNPRHLRPGTQAQNIKQAYERGRFTTQLASAATRLRDSTTGRFTRKELAHVS